MVIMQFFDIIREEVVEAQELGNFILRNGFFIYILCCI